MTTRFSTLPEGLHVNGGYQAGQRRSIVRVGGPSTVVGGPVVSTIGGPIVSNIGGPVIATGGLRRSTVVTGGLVHGNVGPVVSTIGGPTVIAGPSVIGGNHHLIGSAGVGALPGSTIVSGGLGFPEQGLGLRRSTVISPDQIPPGANIIRYEKPAEYIYKNPPVVETRKTTSVVTPQVELRPPVRHTLRGTARAPSGGCPWWLCLILSLLGLLLLAGLLYGFFSGAFGGNKK